MANALLRLIAWVLPEKTYLRFVEWLMKHEIVYIACENCGKQIFADTYEILYNKMVYHSKVCEGKYSE